jgi:hsp70-interacting protein
VTEAYRTVPSLHDSSGILSFSDCLFHTFSYVLILNFGLDFHKIGGFCIFRPCLNSAHGSLRWRAADIIAELTQNNPYCQERVLEAGLLPVLLSLVDVDPIQQVQIKALYAVSCELYSEIMGF